MLSIHMAVFRQPAYLQRWPAFRGTCTAATRGGPASPSQPPPSAPSSSGRASRAPPLSYMTKISCLCEVSCEDWLMRDKFCDEDTDQTGEE